MGDVRVERDAPPLRALKDRSDEKHQLIYADQIMNLAFGPFITRLTVGVEDHATSTRIPVATLVMPTNMIHAMMGEVISQLSSEATKEQFDKAYKEYLGSKVFPK